MLKISPLAFRLILLNSFLTHTLSLVIEYYFSKVTVLLIEYKFSVLFPTLCIFDMKYLFLKSLKNLPHTFFVIYNIFFLHTQHNIISKIQQNKTTDTYSTSQGPIKREGEREGQQEHKSYSFI